MRPGYFEHRVGKVGDGQEFIQERSSQNAVVCRLKVRYLESEEFGPQVLAFLNGNLEVDYPEGVC